MFRIINVAIAVLYLRIVSERKVSHWVWDSHLPPWQHPDVFGAAKCALLLCGAYQPPHESIRPHRWFTRSARRCPYIYEFMHRKF